MIVEDGAVGMEDFVGSALEAIAKDLAYTIDNHVRELPYEDELRDLVQDAVDAINHKGRVPTYFKSDDCGVLGGQAINRMYTGQVGRVYGVSVLASDKGRFVTPEEMAQLPDVYTASTTVVD